MHNHRLNQANAHRVAQSSPHRRRQAHHELHKANCMPDIVKRMQSNQRLVSSAQKR